MSRRNPRQSWKDDRSPDHYDPEFTSDEFIRWLEDTIEQYCDLLQRLHRSVIDDIVDGLNPRLFEVDVTTLQLCDLSKLRHDAKAFTARAGLHKASNYLNYKLSRST